MNIKLLSSTIAGIALLLVLTGLGGCATMEHANTKSLLTQAGFHTLTPSTPKQKEVWAHLQANQVQRATVNGKVFYVFKDEEAGVAYVGHEAEYQRYRELAIQQRVAQEYYMAVEMDRMYAPGWYGAWGPGRIYW
jgi:hypothetical protein